MVLWIKRGSESLKSVAHDGGIVREAAQNVVVKRDGCFAMFVLQDGPAF